LAHIDIHSTQRYLQMMPDLRQAASEHSAQYAMGTIMKDKGFRPWIRRFLLEHLVAERNLSRNTRASYRDRLRSPMLMARRVHPAIGNRRRNGLP
jgi:hypothetical protein